MSIFFFFQSGTKKTLKPVVSDEIVNEAKAKVCEFFIKLKKLRVILHHGVGGGGGVNKCLNMGRLCPKVVTLTLLYTAILRKVVGRNVHVRQSRKVIWDNKLLLFFSIRKHTSMASRDRAIRSNFLKNSELKTTHNTFRDCRVHFFQQPFSK